MLNALRVWRVYVVIEDVSQNVTLTGMYFGQRCYTYFGTSVLLCSFALHTMAGRAERNCCCVFFCLEYVEIWSHGNLHELHSCGSECWGGAISIPLSYCELSQLHTEPCYNYPNNHIIHTECTWLTSPPATGLTTRGNLTGIQPLHSTTFTF